MSLKNLKFQIVLFSNQSAIDPSPENIKKCIDYFMADGFMPSSVQEMDVMAGTSTPRLSLQSSSLGMTFNFLSNRIDITRQLGMPGVPDCGNINDYVSATLNVVSKVTDVFNMAFNRASLISEYMFDNVPTEKLESVRMCFLPQPVLGASQVTEWGIRSVERFDSLGESKESINLVCNVAQQALQIIEGTNYRETQAILVQVDLNTVPEGSDYRFSKRHREKFYADAIPLHDAVLEAMKARVNG